MTKSTFSVFPQALHCHFVFFRAFVGNISAQYDVNDVPFADEHNKHEEALKHVQHVEEVPVYVNQVINDEKTRTNILTNKDFY